MFQQKNAEWKATAQSNRNKERERDQRGDFLFWLSQRASAGWRSFRIKQELAPYKTRWYNLAIIEKAAGILRVLIWKAKTCSRLLWKSITRRCRAERVYGRYKRAIDKPRYPLKRGFCMKMSRSGISKCQLPRLPRRLTCPNWAFEVAFAPKINKNNQTKM